MKITQVTFFTCLILGLGACQKETIIEKQTSPNTYYITETSTIKELTDAGEALVTPAHFMHADMIFDMALKVNPQEPKALLYKKLLKPMMLAKGLATRIKPFAKPGNSVTRFLFQVDGLPETDLKVFLKSPGSEFSTSRDLQDYLAEYREAILEARDYVLEADLSKVVIKLNPILFYPEIQKNYTESCKIVKKTNWGIEIKCDTVSAANLKIAQPDVYWLAQSLTGAAVSLIAYTSYSADGLETIDVDAFNKMTPAQKHNLLDRLPQFGYLRRDEKITSISQMGFEFKLAMQYMLDHQEDVCPMPVKPVEPSYPYACYDNWWNNGEDCEKLISDYQKDLEKYLQDLNKYNNQRPGYLMQKGFCIKDKAAFKNDIYLVDSLLSGPTFLMTKTNQGSMSLRYDVAKMIKNPILDLRQVAPASYSPCGTPTSLKDPTLGGLMPDANAELLLMKTCGQK